jgi:serine/threonine protein kinase
MIIFICHVIVLVSGLHSIHKKGYVHNDLKIENIVVCENAEEYQGYPLLKIIDFGLMEDQEKTLNKRTISGTYSYWVYTYFLD